MKTTTKVTKLVRSGGEGIIDSKRVSDMNEKIRHLEDKGLIVRQKYSLPQLDTVGARFSSHNRTSTQTKEEQYFF